MTPLTWDKSGDRFYQTGLDRGVLYLPDGTAVSWSGLTSFEETSNSTMSSYYFDGVKYYDEITPGDFSGKLKAFTYPDEFDSIVGIAADSSGLSFHDQPSKPFGLSYRTKVGNDLEGDAYGYKIHVLYNLMVNPDGSSWVSKSASPSAIEFAWTVGGTPPSISNYRPTAHISIDSRETSSEVLLEIENALYGTDSSDPGLPTIQDIATMFGVEA